MDAGLAPIAAGVDAGSDAGPPPPRFDAEPIPTEPSPSPRVDEWRAATPVSVSRNRTPCRAYRVREWMKIDCSHLAPSGAAEITGPASGVQIVVAPTKENERPEATERVAEIVFPLRPGTGHVFQILGFELTWQFGYQAAGQAVIITDHWVAGGAPLVTVY
jgi:hypothetical protein